MNADRSRGALLVRALVPVWLPGLLFVASLVYALLVLHPIADDNQRMREQVAGLSMASDQVTELAEKLAILRRALDEESPSYQSMLRDLKGWYVEAHTYINRIAADAGLEVAEMKWGEPEPLVPAFEVSQRRRWVRVGVLVRLLGAWDAHREFARGLSDCECLAQIIESRIRATPRAGQIEAVISFFIYQPDEGERI